MSTALDAHQPCQTANLTASESSPPAVDARAILASHTMALFRRTRSRRGEYPQSVPYCAGCGRSWRGDAEMGGCDAVLLARRVIELEGALLAYVQAHGNVKSLDHDMTEVETFKAFLRAMSVLGLPAEWRAPATGEGE